MSPVSETLPPVRVVLHGKYWDSQIYSGTLVLFGLDGTITRLNWNQFVTSLPLEEELQLVAEAALLGSDRFYSTDMRRLIQDREVKPIVLDKFRRLQRASATWIFDGTHIGHRSDNPLPFPHNDSDYYYGSLYVGARSGVYQLIGNSERSRQRARQRLADAPALDIATKYSTVAFAAGSDGLLELDLSEERRGGLRSIAARSCNTCEWSYASIVCSDQSHSLFVAAFGKVREERGHGPNRSRRYVRRFERLVTDEELFGTSDADDSPAAIQWGAKDKIYRYRSGEVEAVRNSSNGHASFERLERRRVREDFDLDDFVAVRVAPFGSVLEFDDRVIVLLNSGEVLKFQGEPVNWRVFPRSLNYLNHLHLIYDDRIEIVAFTNDYFVSPEERLFGTEPVSADDRFG
ncbi:hypothetical protein [Sorangium sp. So ce406]|uniref:hypothetical protein n=1 Tax=Sorangium sp. So ce406 TaxID=3133311 RepID=UPI003F5B3B7D